MDKDITILTTEYFPPISTLWALSTTQKGFLEIHENYQKKSSRNRTRILGVNGIEVLSVPLKKGKNNKKPIREVEIFNDENWQIKHIQSIQSAYGNAPYFDFYIDEIQALLLRKYTLLLELNSAILHYFLETMQLEVALSTTSRYQPIYDERYLDLRKMNFSKSYPEGFAAKKYNQVFEEKHGFLPNLSILDLLMCKGPESILYL